MKQRLLDYLKSDRHYWWTVSVLPGLYALIYLYKKNFNLVNSVDQLLGLGFWFLAVPTAAILILDFIFKKKIPSARPKLYFSFLLAYLAIVISLITFMGWRWKGLILVTSLIVVISFFIAKHYKKLVLILGIMTLLLGIQFAYFYLTQISQQKKWIDEEVFNDIKFVKNSNIYLIQPDGYAGKLALSNSDYNYDNSSFYESMSQRGFKFNHDFRSNYTSTLTSNASLFTGQHHYYLEGEMSGELYKARNIIVGENPALKALKNNGYRLNFISQTPYLFSNHPDSFYDDTNVDLEDVQSFPFFSADLNYLDDFKKKVSEISASNQPEFLFVEILKPGHISTLKKTTLGKAEERKAYLKRLEDVNKDLVDMVDHIRKQDQTAIIIIAADHAGFVGMDYTDQLHEGILEDQESLKYGAFNSLLAYSAPTDFETVADEIKSSIAIFPSLFAYLSDKRLKGKFDHASYGYIQEGSETKVVRYFDNNGNPVTEQLD